MLFRENMVKKAWGKHIFGRNGSRRCPQGTRPARVNGVLQFNAGHHANGTGIGRNPLPLCAIFSAVIFFPDLFHKQAFDPDIPVVT